MKYCIKFKMQLNKYIYIIYSHHKKKGKSLKHSMRFMGKVLSMVLNLSYTRTMIYCYIAVHVTTCWQWHFEPVSVTVMPFMCHAVWQLQLWCIIQYMFFLYYNTNNNNTVFSLTKTSTYGGAIEFEIVLY